MNSIISACMSDNKSGCFHIMYINDKNNLNIKEHSLIEVKWYASIFQNDHGYIINCPDTRSSIEKVYILDNVKSVFIDKNILYIPLDLEPSLQYCINVWCSKYRVNEYYFLQNCAVGD